MNVLLITNMYPTQEKIYYGIFVKEYVSSLAKLGLKVDLFFTDASKDRFNYFRDIPKLRRSLSGGKYDIVHLQHTFCVYQLAFAELFKKKAKSILTLHEGEISASGKNIPYSWDIAGQLVYSKQIKRWAMNYVDHLVSVAEHLPAGVGFRKEFSVTAPGVDLDLFKPLDKAECRNKLGLPVDKTILFFPADPKLTATKGYPLLSQSIEYLSPTPLLLTGGSIPHSDMPLYMNAADVIALTSNYEASPMVVKEAMACNTPVTATDAGDIKMIFGKMEGHNIAERNPSDFAEKLKEAIAFGRKTKGRDRIIQLGLSLEDVGKKYVRLYEKLVHSS